MSKRNKNFLWIVILVIISVFLGVNLGKIFRMNTPQAKLLRTKQNKINEALGVISENYVDTVDMNRLTESVVKNLLNELDPHSSYIPADDVEAANEDLSSSFSGIGVQFNMQTDTIIIISVVSGGPAEKAGLMPFDRVIAVDDSIVAGKDLGTTKVMKMLRGKKDSKVKLGIQRGDSENLVDFELTRGDIPNYSVDVSYMVSDNIGFIKVTKFAASTYHEFLTAIAKLKSQGAKGFIIDLRDNPGGYMETAIRMINEFLPKGRLIVYMEGNAYPRSDTYSNGTGSCQNDPLVLLINELSGSASEIFSGAIQDNDRGLIIGRRSYGKGLVQTNIELSDKSELHLTIGRYYTPSGRCIQKQYELGKADEYSEDIYNRYVHGEFDTADSIKLNDSLMYTTNNGRTVYGGGGIMPDIFIPRDTVGITTYYSNVVNTGVLYQYALQYSDKNREKLSSFTSYQELYSYLKNQPLMSDFVNYASAKGIKRYTALINISKNLIETQIHAYIIRNFFDNEGFYPVFFKDDITLKKAIEVINNGSWNPQNYLSNDNDETNHKAANSQAKSDIPMRCSEKIFRNYMSKSGTI